MRFKILDKPNELRKSIACGSKPTARCKTLSSTVMLAQTLRKVGL